jgi:predicted RNase H-like nuclease
VPPPADAGIGTYPVPGNPESMTDRAGGGGTNAGGEVVGCDVGRGKWVAVVLEAGAFRRALVAGALAEIAADCAAAAVIAVDIPIGLPELWPRPADRRAREFVGPRRHSVFLTPVRAAVEEPDFAKATAVHVAATGKGISRQAHALSRMILDAEAVAAADDRIYEAHPEASFRAMGDAVLADPKTTWNGMRARLALLAEHGIELPRDLAEAGRVRPDDVIDAAALGWTAGRIAAGSAIRLGEPAPSSRAHAIYV